MRFLTSIVVFAISFYSYTCSAVQLSPNLDVVITTADGGQAVLTLINKMPETKATFQSIKVLKGNNVYLPIPAPAHQPIIDRLSIPLGDTLRLAMVSLGQLPQGFTSVALSDTDQTNLPGQSIVMPAVLVINVTFDAMFPGDTHTDFLKPAYFIFK